MMCRPFYHRDFSTMQGKKIASDHSRESRTGEFGNLSNEKCSIAERD